MKFFNDLYKKNCGFVLKVLNYPKQFTSNVTDRVLQDVGGANPFKSSLSLSSTPLLESGISDTGVHSSV